MERDNGILESSTADSSGNQSAKTASCTYPADRHQGAALGPEWLAKSKLLDSLDSSVRGALGKLTIHYEQDIIAIRNGEKGKWVQLTEDYSDIQEAFSQTNSGVIDSDVYDARELGPFPLYVRTSKGTDISCDFLISATGVTPSVDFVGQEFERIHVEVPLKQPCAVTALDQAGSGLKHGSNVGVEGGDEANRTAHITQGEEEKEKEKEETFSSRVVDYRSGSIERNNGALVVNERMETSVSKVFAAGDCCHYRASNPAPGGPAHTSASASSGSHFLYPTAVDEEALSGTHWFQMRLWTQARSMGIYAAQCMTEQQEHHGGDFFFDIFAHVTRFFGYKVRDKYLSFHSSASIVIETILRFLLLYNLKCSTILSMILIGCAPWSVQCSGPWMEI